MHRMVDAIYDEIDELYEIARIIQSSYRKGVTSSTTRY